MTSVIQHFYDQYPGLKEDLFRWALNFWYQNRRRARGRELLEYVDWHIKHEVSGEHVASNMYIPVDNNKNR